MIGITPNGNYFDHLLSGWQSQEHPNVKWICYEDMKADLAGEIERSSTPCNESKLPEKCMNMRVEIQYLKKNIHGILMKCVMQNMLDFQWNHKSSQINERLVESFLSMIHGRPGVNILRKEDPFVMGIFGELLGRIPGF